MKYRLAIVLLTLPLMLIDAITLPFNLIYWLITGENLSSRVQEMFEKEIENKYK